MVASLALMRPSQLCFMPLSGSHPRRGVTVALATQELYVDLAARLKAVVPGARTDPFYEARMVSYFMRGVEDPEAHFKWVRGVERRRKEAAPEEAVKAPPRRRSRQTSRKSP